MIKPRLILSLIFLLSIAKGSAQTKYSLESIKTIIKNEGLDSLRWKYKIYAGMLPLLDSTTIPLVIDAEQKSLFAIEKGKPVYKFPDEAMHIFFAYRNNYAREKLISYYRSIPRHTSSDTDYLYPYTLFMHLRSIAEHDKKFIAELKSDHTIWYKLSTTSMKTEKEFNIDTKRIAISIAVILCIFKQAGFDKDKLAAIYGESFITELTYVKDYKEHTLYGSVLNLPDEQIKDPDFKFQRIKRDDKYLSIQDYLEKNTEIQIFDDVSYYGLRYKENSIYDPIIYAKNRAVISISSGNAWGTVLIQIVDGTPYKKLLMFAES